MTQLKPQPESIRTPGEEIIALHAALELYGEHLLDCKRPIQTSDEGCSCGFTATLKRIRITTQTLPVTRLPARSPLTILEAQQRVRQALLWLQSQEGVTLEYYCDYADRSLLKEALHILGIATRGEPSD